MEISEDLECLFSASVEERDGAYVIDIPEREVKLGALEEATTYRVALLPSTTESRQDQSEEPAPQPQANRGQPTAPVQEGETRRVEIENIGEQGDGITRVERGFVVIVPDTESGERVKINITDVRENVAFGEVVERLSYYD